jgi:DNA-3-methyladenine glycosylase I
MSGYCDFAADDPLHADYHNREYGFPVASEDALFERLMLEINQAGLSWRLILQRRATLRRGYADFSVDAVAAFGEADRARLLADPGVIRHRLKVEAAIANARRIQEIRRSHGGFDRWLEAHHPRSKAEWVKLFRQSFRFAGPEIVGEFLMSIGYLPGAHRADCPVYAEIAAKNPAWMQERA